MQSPTTRLVLLQHVNRQVRAAWFDLAHRTVLTEAAAQPQHALVEIEATKLKELAPDIQPGKLAANGKPDILPLALVGPFQRLLELAKVGALVTKAAVPATAPASATAKSDVPPPWSEIVVGSVVLASEGGENGWFECVVVAFDGNSVRLRWRDYPDVAPFYRPVNRLGLLSFSGLC
jgi:hypothetical protein